MLNSFAKALDKNPLVAIEHMIYVVMIVIGVWGLSPGNSVLNINRLVGELGLYLTVGLYTLYIIAGMVGHIAIITMRINHRINTSRFAFFVFSFAAVSSIGLLYAGGDFTPTLMLNVLGLLISGIIFLHLKIHQRSGAVGRYRDDGR